MQPVFGNAIFFRLRSAVSKTAGLRWILPLLLVYHSPVAFAQTTLSPGDIAILGASPDGGDEFTFIFLTDIEAGTVVRFSDTGWDATTDSWVSPSETYWYYTAPSALSAGAIVEWTSAAPNFTIGSSSSCAGDNGSVSLNLNGDQIVVFQGDPCSPDLLYVIDWNSTSWFTGPSHDRETDIPDNLENNLTAIARGSGPNSGDNWENIWYTGVTTGTKTEILQAIGDPSNWSGSNSSGSYSPPIVNLSIVSAPGGTSTNLTAWFKADADVKNTGVDIASGAVDQWDNQVSNASLTSLTQSTGSRQPDKVADAINYNPSIRFDGSNDIYQQNVDSDDFRGNNDFTYYTILIKPSGVSGVFYNHKESGSGNSGKVSLSTSSFTIGAAFNNDFGPNSVGAATYLGTDPVMVTSELNGGTYSGFKNGEYVWENTSLSGSSETGTFGIGALVDGTTASFNLSNGDVAELVIFSGAQNAADRQKVMSYLAVKYGMTLENADNDGAVAEGDYIASNDVVVWDGDLAGANATYHNQVTAIGRDDASLLAQIKSQSSKTGSVLAMALTDQGGTFDTPDGFDADLEFLVFGDNGGDMSTLGSTVDGVDNAAVARVWKVQETGTIGNVTLRIAAADVPTGTYNLFVSDNSSFTAGTVSQYRLEENGANLEVAVDFNNGDFFTLGTIAPGGVGGGITNWFKANSTRVKLAGGTVTTGTVDEWENEFTNLDMLEVTQSTPAERPSIVQDAVNFNPVIELNDGEWLFNEDVSHSTFRTTTEVSLYGVYNTNKVGENATAFAHMDEGGDNNSKVSLGTEFAAWNKSGGPTYSTTIGSSFVISSVVVQDGNTDSSWVAWRNGAFDRLRSDAQIDPAVAATGWFSIGGLKTDAVQDFYLDGNLAELVTYNERHDDNDRERVESYLAIKYGITLDHDYKKSDGLTIWDLTTNTGYNDDIAGIGRDGRSALMQTQSRSINTDDIVAIDKGGVISTDQAFLIWGNDGGDTSQSEFTDVDGSTVQARVKRVWKVQETNDVGTVSITFDLSNVAGNKTSSGLRLLIDRDGDGFADNDIAPLTGILTGDEFTVSGVDLQDGDFLTLGNTEFSAPGGVASNLQIWLNAKVGVKHSGSDALDGETVNTWEDQSGVRTNDATDANSSLPPTLRTNLSAFNFNDAVEFDGATEHLDFQEDYVFMTGTGLTAFAVIQPDVVADKTLALITDFGNWTSASYGLAYSAENYRIHTANLHGGVNQSDTHTRGDVTTLMRMQVNFGNEQYIFLDGSQVGSEPIPGLTQLSTDEINETSTHELSSGPFTIGRLAKNGNLSSNNGRAFDGRIGEVIFYDADLDPADAQKVESYLAMKYGISLSTDYVASNGATIWDGTANAGYSNDITGIGRDDRSTLSQTTSKSINADAIVTMDKGGAISTDRAFLTWGNDDQSVDQIEYGDVDGTTIKVRMKRVWKIQETNDVGTVDITFDLSTVAGPKTSSTLRLLIDRDGDGFNDNDVTPLSGTLTGDDFTVSGVDLQDGDFFTLGNTELSAPGSVSTGLQLWLNAGTGVKNSGNDATDGQVVNTWEDISGNRTNDANDVNNSIPPTLRTNLADFNFNNAIEFDGETEHLDFGGDYVFATGTGLTAFALVKPDNVAGKTVPMVLDFGNLTSNGYGMGYSSDFYRGHTPTNENGANTEGSHTRGDALTLVRFQIDLSNEQYIFLDGELVDSAPIAALPQMSAAEINDNSSDGSSSGPMTVGRQSKSFGLSNNGGRGFDGRIAEIILYDLDLAALDAQKVETYLGLKYGVTLGEDLVSSSGSTIWDNTANSTYSFDISGIGRDDDAQFLKLRSKSSNGDGIVTMEKPGSFSTDETFLIWGNDNASMNANETGDVDGSTIEARMKRTWSVVETGDAGTVTVTLDVSAIPGTVNGADLRLLIDRDGDGFADNDVAPIEGTLVGNDFIVTGVDFQTGDRFTLGSVDASSTTLPIELMTFTAQPERGVVQLKWSTATETNNSHFDLERSVDGIHWKVFQQVAGAGTSLTPIHYDTEDPEPYFPVSYYRLKQTDYDGQYSYSPIERVSMGPSGQLEMNIYPSPNAGQIVATTVVGLQPGESATLSILQASGRMAYSHTEMIGSNGQLHHHFNPKGLTPGIYLVRLTTAKKEFVKRIIITLDD